MQNSTPILSIASFLLAAIFGAVGSYLYKSGADDSTGMLRNYLMNPRILGGVCCYITVMVLFVFGFSKGGALSVLYPTYATTFIFSAVIALVAYETPIRSVNVMGMALLVSGMYLMGKQS